MQQPADNNSSHRPATFTVVMPAYNHADYIDEAISSIRKQTFEQWELIVVDDGSTDATAEIAGRHGDQDSRITVIHQANAGPAAARNTGIAAGTAPWLAFLDSDDLWYPETLAHYARAIADRPDCRFFYGYRDRLNADGTETAASGQFQDAATGTAELFGRMYLSTMVVCMARSLVTRAGGFDQGLRSCEDYELFLRLSLMTSFHPIGLATGLRRRHERNVSKQTGFSRFQEAEILRRFVASPSGAGRVPDELVARRLARLYYASGRQYFKSLCLRKALIALGESLAMRRSAKAMVLKAICLPLVPLGRDDGRPIPRLSGKPA